MASVEITQAEADALLAMEKCRTDDRAWDYPSLGGRISVPLCSLDKREAFTLDVGRSGRIALKGKYQNRSRQVFVLARLDLGGGSHRNPDDTEVACPHLHLYREGYGDKWAFPIPEKVFTDISDPWRALTDFMTFCNIVESPIINPVLFI